MEDKDLCRWGVNGTGGGWPLMGSVSMGRRGMEGWGFLWSELVWLLCGGGTGGGGPLWKPELES